ncbi:MAG: FtsX-like permease family protein [Candidatus Symbiothrix sp.]|jgi:putative ABC transport system permease protein|nr:FtsX-like permease family protein [Candidatus Symbiothrix sp.]
MIKFLWKGIIRDKGRSLLPVIVVSIGVLCVVFLDGLMGGVMNNMVKMTANFQTGHLKVMTRAYNGNEAQKPNDLALLEVDELIKDLHQKYPNIDWNPRISFGGLLDIPDSRGETKAQGPVAGSAYDLLSDDSKEAERLGLQKSLIAGQLIRRSGEIIISSDFADKFNVQPGDTLTFFGSTMYGSMSFMNYAVAGVIRFGVGMLDKGAIILDLSDARQLLDMDNAAGEILGFLPDEHYDREITESIKQDFNAAYADNSDEFAPVMLQLADQNGMRDSLSYMGSVSFIMVLLLVFALSIVLWNTGVLGGIRRYNEFGVRLAIGEEKKHIYHTLLVESLLIGGVGSVIGTAFGLGISYLISIYGIDYGAMMENLSMMIDPVLRAEVTLRMFYIGFIPGVLSMLIGTALSGQAIYKRNTAMLFKELD